MFSCSVVISFNNVGMKVFYTRHYTSNRHPFCHAKHWRKIKFFRFTVIILKVKLSQEINSCRLFYEAVQPGPGQKKTRFQIDTSGGEIDVNQITHF